MRPIPKQSKATPIELFTAVRTLTHGNGVVLVAMVRNFDQEQHLVDFPG